MNDDELTFEELLEAIFSRRNVPIHLLYRLSDLTPSESDTFFARWHVTEDARRRSVARHMADLSEENYIVDFAPLFGEMLSDPAGDVRLAALDGLWDCSNMALLPPIIGLMVNDENTQVRSLAAATLGHFVLMAEWGQIDIHAGEQAVEALLSVNADPLLPDDVRRATVESLGASGDTRVPAIIHKAYYEGDDELQLAAVFAMGRSADARWLPIVMEEMDSLQDEMRTEAARAAGGIGHSDAVDRLIDLIDDDELEVRLAALTSLGQIGSELAVEALRRKMDDPYATDEEREAAESSLEEAVWLAGEMDFSLLSWDDEEGDDDSFAFLDE